jgi:hypothetical protein
MTTVEVLYRYATPPTEQMAIALASTRDVYGIRRILIDSAAQTLLVEYDATRLNTATVGNIVRSTGLKITEELPLTVPQPEPEAVAKA